MRKCSNLLIIPFNVGLLFFLLRLVHDLAYAFNPLVLYVFGSSLFFQLLSSCWISNCLSIHTAIISYRRGTPKVISFGEDASIRKSIHGW